MTRTLPLPYAPGPQDHADDTPTGHTFAAAWWTLSGFGVLSAMLILTFIGEAAIYKLFGA